MSKAEPDAGIDDGWKIGALATASGLTVRALHHYDSVGLLTASGRTAAGHRIYSAQDVARLYQTQFLRRLDLSLAEITRALDDPDWDIREAIRLHVHET